jgi:hypothetical protein
VARAVLPVLFIFTSRSGIVDLPHDPLTHAEDNFYRGESWQSPDTVPMTDEQMKEMFVQISVACSINAKLLRQRRPRGTQMKEMQLKRQ